MSTGTAPASTAPVSTARASRGPKGTAPASAQVITRPLRLPAPSVPTGEMTLAAPPMIAKPATGRARQMLMVLPMLAGTVATALMFGMNRGGPTAYVIGAIFGLSTLGMLITNWTSGPHQTELVAARRDYLRYLSRARQQVREVIDDQRVALHHRHPQPQSLWAHAMGPRVWERRGGDPDFAIVRVGVGTQSLATPLIAPETEPAADLEPVTAGALRRFLDTYSLVEDLPVAVSVRSFGRVAIRDLGPETGAGTDVDADTRGTSAPDRAAHGRARALARAMLCQLATFHAPDDLVIAALVSARRHREWDWLKWLPHSQHPSATDALGTRRLVTSDPSELDELLPGPASAQRVVVVVDEVDPAACPRLVTAAGPAGAPAPAAAALGPGAFAAFGGIGGAGPAGIAPAAGGILPGGGGMLPGMVVEAGPGMVAGGTSAPAAGITVIEIGATPRCGDPAELGLGITLDGGLVTSTLEEQGGAGRADALSLVEAEVIARRLAPLRLSGAAGASTAPSGERDLAELLDLPDLPTAPVSRLWAPRSARELLRLPIGTGPDGTTVVLDLKEAAQGGMGPHGLVVGATGSGKSELLRTLVLGLALTHSSQTLNFVLIDFKGGATFASLDALPHTSAVITNLADALPLVDRMHDAMRGELNRRQELLRQAGNLSSVRDYERVRATDREDLPPLCTLLLVCDEFTEMLAAKPDLIDLFVQIGRIGRSVGIHLLLATQRLEEGRLRGLETNLSYRIALRTFSAHESRIALSGADDAFNLPAAPGHGYLRVGTEPLQRFRAAYSSGPYRGGEAAAAAVPRILDLTSTRQPEAPQTTGPGASPRALTSAAAPSLLKIIVGRLAGQGPSAHRVWLPPLAQAPDLETLLGGLTVVPGQGLGSPEPSLRGRLRVPIGLLDKPYEQRRDVAWFDLSGSAGHVAIAGTVQSGKSTAVRTLVTALALSHTPLQVQVYCLDFGGGSLAALRVLPHVGGVAGRADIAAVRRTVGEVATLLADREQSFAAHGIDSMAALRRHTASGDPEVTHRTGLGGDVFLVIDGWATLQNEYEDLTPVLADLATRGLGYGIHLVVTATRWSDLRPNLRDLFASRLELRLGDPVESLIDRRAAANVPLGEPGRGLNAAGVQALVALPRSRELGPAALAEAMVSAWTGPRAPAVRLLPDRVPYAALLTRDCSGRAAPVGSGLDLPLGIAENDLRAALVDFASEPHLLVFGDSESGKSNLLRVLAESIVRRFAPEQARVVLVDYRRSLLGTITSEHLIGYGTTEQDTGPLIESVASYMDRRRPGPDITPAQLRDRSWWTGPECFVLVDDYDLVATGSGNPLLPLLPYLPQARDVGLHLVVARRAGGAGRAIFEPVLQRLRELGSPGIVMSGNKDEGALVGNLRPGPLPPGRGWLITRKHGPRLVQTPVDQGQAEDDWRSNHGGP